MLSILAIQRTKYSEFAQLQLIELVGRQGVNRRS